MRMQMDNVLLVIFILRYVSLCFLHEKSYAADTSTPNNPIIDGQELTSSGESFVLGFFSPGSSKRRYVGVWYKNIMPQTVVWVANREKPLNDTNGKLTIAADRNIVLLDGSEDSIWSTNTSRAIQEPFAKLLDSGNFVLMDAKDGDSDNYIWQSFDYPSDTLIPGMKLGWDRKTGLNRSLTSWKSADDPSAGNFTYSFDHTGFPQMVLRQGFAIWFRSGIWNGVHFNDDPWESFTAFC